jgi:8-oxo-dGTP pyrophosphatase MutT (NUDIX family)
MDSKKRYPHLMYTKSSLITDIEKYTPFDAIEAQHKAAILELLRNTDHCFKRSDFPGHVVGGAWVISPDGTEALLTHHKILDNWFQFGGHADGEIDIRNVALREAQEESGIDDLSFITSEIFDIDVHPIPANPKKNEPAHMHYELRYFLRANHKNQIMSDESLDVKWFSLEELQHMDFDPSRKRMITKWQHHLHG